MGTLSLLLGSRGKASSAPAILRYLGIQSLKIANFGLFYTKQVFESRQIVILKDTMKG